MPKASCWTVLSLQPEHQHERRRYTIQGAVQGVGFRPFIYRLATESCLTGWVQNTSAGVIIEVEGSSENITAFDKRLQPEQPTHSVIDHIGFSVVNPIYDTGFRIVFGDDSNDVSASVLPDLAVCSDCLREMNDVANRRHRYPFINCTNCGPRFTVMTALPYDRPRTSMAGFEMCASCRAEYEDCGDRRFHAQTVACPVCGPHLELWNAKGQVMASRHKALEQAVEAIRDGKIVALKGLGGFHLVCEAMNDRAVQLLRARKHRKTKPFAVMYPSLETVKNDCLVSPEEERLLCSAAAPIVILRHRDAPVVAPSVAPNNPYLGVMLPYTPMHDLIMKDLGRPIVATSGNRASEPVCIDGQEALDRLSGIADLFLLHNRPIINRADDSIARIAAGREMVLRRGRGYAPLPVIMHKEARQTVLACGGHLKNAVAFAKGNRLVLSAHVGDLDTLEACDAHEKAVKGLIDFYRDEPSLIVHDAHPDYRSTRTAQSRLQNCLPVQHHYAHALSCMLDNGLDAPCFAVVWDGTGYGVDGTIWGGEFLNISEDGYLRTAHFLPFPLPGGESAIREPYRSTLGLLYTMGTTSPEGQELLWQAMKSKINAPLTSSAGRLFDAVAALTGICQQNSFEGEAAMALEYAALKSDCAGTYDFIIKDGLIDWRPMVQAILTAEAADKAQTARRFHNTLTAIIVTAAQKQANKLVLLTGGCFQNQILLESTVDALRRAGFDPFWHRRVPTNDGGLAAGQVLAALRGM